MAAEPPVNWPFAFPAMRSLRIAGAQGAYLFTSDGREILDAAGGAVAVNVGHGRKEVADAMHAAALASSYVVPPWLTPERERLLRRLTAEWLPPSLPRLHLTCSGSEGVETAMKIAIQYHAARGQPSKKEIIGRAPSYHGTTLAAAAVGGHEARKQGLAHALPRYPRVPAPYPLRCPGSDVAQHCLDALQQAIEHVGADNVAALLGEPIVGASGGALVPPDGYWQGVRELCDHYDILLLADEVMTGFGRTGAKFALGDSDAHWPVAVDVLVAGKGLGGGYAPITGVFATEAVGAAIQAAGMNVMFHTFAAHPAACAAADKVLEIMAAERLVERAARVGADLLARLGAAFLDHPHVAEVRGKGLLLGIEIVANRTTLERYPQEAKVTSQVAAAALERGVCFYPGGTGEVRDVVVLGPPLIVGETELQRMVDALLAAVDETTRNLDR